jgi:amino acid adenylation domain-containing protein
MNPADRPEPGAAPGTAAPAGEALAERLAALSPEARRALRARLSGASAAAAEIPLQPRDGRDFPLSMAQERLWFLDQLMPGNPFYNIALAQRLAFVPEPRALNRALQDAVARHEALRTRFPRVDQQPVQRIAASVHIAYGVDDLRGPDAEARAAQLAAAFCREPFDLVAGPLLRCRLLLLGPAQAVLLLVIHHIVADGWSLEKLLDELGQAYRAHAAGRTPALAKPAVQYADYAVWQRETLRGERLERHRAYWVRQLRDLPELVLPTDHPRPPRPSFRGARCAFVIDAPTTAAVDALAQRVGSTRFTVLAAAFGLLLHRLAGQDEVVIGTPMAARDRPELEDAIGFFANTVVLRLAFAGAASFEEAVTRTDAVLRAAQDHQEMPFSLVVAALAPAQDLSRNPLFQVSFQVLASSGPSGGGGAAATLPFERGSSAFDLTLQLAESAAGLEGQLEYSTDLFEAASAARIVERYARFVTTALRTPAAALAGLDLMAAHERAQLAMLGHGKSPARPGQLVHELIAAQAQRSPQATACSAPDGELTYADLAARTTRLARRLLEHGVGAGDCVGVAIEPSTDLPVALLAVLQAGAAYVPLEPTLPPRRARAMLADAGAHLLIARADIAPELAEGLTVLAVQGEPAPRASLQALPRPRDDAPAYVLFTSGSTGRPKGVAVSHGALRNYLLWCLDAYPVQAGDGAPLCTSIGADMSVTTLFVPLLCGKTVFLLPSGGGLDALESALRGPHRYSFVKVTPSHLEGLRHLAGSGAPACGAACFIIGGEALHAETLAPWRAHWPELLIANEYGPTETTVGCCAHLVRAGHLAPGPGPTGRPIAATQLHVCDSAGAPVPLGVVGELLIGGAGVALGYVGLPERSAERFVAGPGGARVYRSGDRVRWRHDGLLEYLGRADEQIKLRGHRVEPAEIEAALREHPAVADAVVVLQRGGAGDDRLLAAVRLAEPQAIAAAALGETLRRHLRTRLPAYMLPSVFGEVDSIPLTSSGKADRLRIAALLADVPARAGQEAPATALEALLVHIYADVLKAPKVGVGDDFFADLGGHSLLATRLVSQLRELLQIELPLRIVFEARSPRELAAALGGDGRPREALEAAARIVLDVLAMSDDEVQRRLERDEGGSTCA